MAKSLDIRMDRLKASRNLLSRTKHPEKSPQLTKVAEAIQKTNADIKIYNRNIVPAEVIELEAQVDDLIKLSENKFEEALVAFEKNSGIFNTNTKVHKERILKKIRDRQAATLQQYDTVMKSRLVGVEFGDVTREYKLILPQLKPALVPVTVEDTPAPRFVWMQEFCALFETQLDPIKGALTLPVDDVLACAAGFDAAGQRALGVDLLSGFRAARNMAHKIRMARLRDLVDNGDVSKPEYRQLGEQMLAAIATEWAASEKVLKARLEENEDADVKRYVDRMTSERDFQVVPLRKRMEKTILDYERLVKTNAKAGKARGEIASRKVMAEPMELRRVVDELGMVERLSYFAELPREAQARILFNRAVAKAVQNFLDAESPAYVSDQVRSDVSRAFALDPEVDVPWRDALSPRIMQIFDALKSEK